MLYQLSGFRPHSSPDPFGATLPPGGGDRQVRHAESAILSDGAFAYFFPKLTAQMAAVKGTASMTPMELATAEMASRLM